MEEFCKWFRHDLDDLDFILNLVLIAMTDGWWFWIMLLYYWLFKRKDKKEK